MKWTYGQITIILVFVGLAAVYIFSGVRMAQIKISPPLPLPKPLHASTQSMQAPAMEVEDGPIVEIPKNPLFEEDQVLEQKLHELRRYPQLKAAEDTFVEELAKVSPNLSNGEINALIRHLERRYNDAGPRPTLVARP